MTGVALVAALAAAGDPRWVELRAVPATPEARARLIALGAEVKPLEDGSWSVYLTDGERAAFEATGVPLETVHPDLESWYRSRLVATPLSSSGLGSMGGYLTWSEAVAEMDRLAAAHPALAAPKRPLGRSHEGRDIWAWKLSRDPAVDEDEPAAIFLSLMHAREPEGLMSLVHFAEHLLEGYGSDAEATWLLDHREAWIVPVLNPDGYVYNETTSPGGGGMWRKNRRDNGDGTFGVDLNRNFSYEWGRDDAGSSPNPASDTYRGPAAFSEPETRALRDLAIAVAPAIAVNTHTWSDALLRPWGHIDGRCGDDAVFEDLSRQATRGTAYLPGNFQQALGYLANGSHDDWMWGDTVAKPRVYGLTPELGNLADGFWPPTARIDPLRREALGQHLSLLWAAGAAPRLDAWTVSDLPPGGDGDGWPEPGEMLAVVVTVGNHGLGPTDGPLLATLAASGCELQMVGATADLGVVDARSSADNAAAPFAVRVLPSASPGALARLTLTVADGGGELPPLALAVLVGEPQVVFADDFESGLAAWSATGFATEPAGAGRAGLALTDSPGSDYPRRSDATAGPAASFDLSGFARAWLVFDHRLWVDNDFDAASVEARDGVAPWTPVPGETSEPGSGAGVQAAGAPIWDGHRFEFGRERVDLSAFAGAGRTATSFRLRLRSDDDFGYDGWRVDDVMLLGFTAGTAAAPGDPAGLLAVERGLDVVLEWTPPAPGPGQDAAESYSLHRSGSIRSEAGFTAVATGLRSPTAADPGVLGGSSSWSYRVQAANCAGSSPPPPP